MLCEIYKAEYCMKRKYFEKAYMDIDYYHWLEDKGLETHCYEGANWKYVDTHSNRHHFYFTQWELIAYDFNPEDFNHMKWFWRNIGFEKHLIAQPISDWYPKKNKITFRRYGWNFSTYCYKVVCDGQIIDMAPYFKQYNEELDRRWNEKKEKWESELEHVAPYRFYLRRPHTANEKRQSLIPQEVREYQEEYGITLKTRGRRKAENLPCYWDDKYVNVSRSWKDRTKQKHQYKSKSTKRKRYVRGHIL